MIKVIIEEDLFIENKEIDELKTEVDENLCIIKKGTYELRDKKANSLCLKMINVVNISYGEEQGMFNIKIKMKHF